MSNDFCATAQSATLDEDPVEEQEESQNDCIACSEKITCIRNRKT